MPPAVPAVTLISAVACQEICIAASKGPVFLSVDGELTFNDLALELSHSSDQTAALVALLESRRLSTLSHAKITDEHERVGFSDDRKRVIEALVEFPPRD